MKTDKIDLTRLRNSEHFQFISDVITLVNQTTPAALKAEAQAAALAAAHAREDEALKKITKSVLTAQIHEADAARDKVFRNIADTVRTQLNSYLPAVAAAAKKALIPIETYGNLAKKPDAEETADIYNLVKDLQNTYAEEVVTLGLAQTLTELLRTNKVTEDLMNARYAETSGRTELVLQQVRAEVDEAYFVLTERIDALRVIEGGAVYTEFIGTLNDIIERATNIVAARRGRAKAKKEEEANTAADETSNE